jgi:hypothetical protein
MSIVSTATFFFFLSTATAKWTKALRCQIKVGSTQASPHIQPWMDPHGTATWKTSDKQKETVKIFKK